MTITDKKKTFWFGLFVVLVLALVAWLMVFLKPSIGDGRLLLTVRCSNIDKISVGTRVNFAGKPVGEVVEIKEVDDPRGSSGDAYGNLYFYELILRVDSSVHIYTYDEIAFATAGLLGEKSIAIIPRAAPTGSSPHEITHEVLYTKSCDKVEETLNKFSNVAVSLNDVLENVSKFISGNGQDINTTLSRFGETATEVKTMINQMNQQNLSETVNATASKLQSVLEGASTFLHTAEENHMVERLGKCFDSLNEIAQLCKNKEGTLSHLLNSDSLYMQMTGVLQQIQNTLSDVNTYGILYQFDRKWQKKRDLNQSYTENPGARYRLQKEK